MHCATTDTEKRLVSTATGQVNDCARLASRCIKVAQFIFMQPSIVAAVICSNASVKAPAEDRHTAHAHTVLVCCQDLAVHKDTIHTKSYGTCVC